jgi:hypothetical protein
MPEISPEVQESADRLTARHALVGAASYPFVVVLVGLAAGLPSRNPHLFTFLVAAVLALESVQSARTAAGCSSRSGRQDERGESWRAATRGRKLLRVLRALNQNGAPRLRKAAVARMPAKFLHPSK